MNAGFERVIEYTDPISSEDEYSVVVFQDAQEDFCRLVTSVQQFQGITYRIQVHSSAGRACHVWLRICPLHL
jgi:hypothetical protein